MLIQSVGIAAAGVVVVLMSAVIVAPDPSGLPFASGVCFVLSGAPADIFGPLHDLSSAVGALCLCLSYCWKYISWSIC